MRVAGFVAVIIGASPLLAADVQARVSAELAGATAGAATNADRCIDDAIRENGLDPTLDQTAGDDSDTLAPWTFVRVSANDEGWVVVGYRVANESVDETWMLLDVGISLVEEAMSDTITRDSFKLVTPEDRVVPMSSQREFEKAIGTLAPLMKRARMVGDSLDYFPRGVRRSYDLDLFVDSAEWRPRPTPLRQELLLSGRYAYVGTIFFEVPDGIQIGFYRLEVSFASGTVTVPIEIMTEERASRFDEELRRARRR